MESFGIFADIALAVHILLIFASMVLLGATLTLPGIAGIVFTIGMAVDSNVLIYERIREEAHMGRSVLSALDAGFKRAFATIVDSNVTMFVAALILYLFGSGAVRGFAVSLGLGIITSIVTAVTMTRMMIALWYRQLAPDEDSDMIPARRPSRPKFGMKLLPPRAGKHQIRLHAAPPRQLSAFGRAFDHFRALVPVRRHEFRHRFRRRDAGRSARQERRNPHGRLPRKGREPGAWPGRSAADRRRRRRAAAHQRAAGRQRGRADRGRKTASGFWRCDYEFRSVDSVGPSVSSELVQSGTLGVVVAILAVLTYLWFRFEWQFAVGAIIGTMHDLLLTVGFFCVTQIEFNQTSIAAILTIVGYSLNETVVVLDRIREMMRKYKRLSTAEIVDMSVNAVLPRTIMTATTVFLALLALFFLGGHVIRSFSAAMIWGIFVATYSSIFICSPMLIYMGVRADVFDKQREKEDGVVTDPKVKA